MLPYVPIMFYIFFNVLHKEIIVEFRELRAPSEFRNSGIPGTLYSIPARAAPLRPRPTTASCRAIQTMPIHARGKTQRENSPALPLNRRAAMDIGEG